VPQASFGLSKRVGAAPPAPTANRIAQLKALMAAQEEAARQRAAAQEQAARQHAAQQAELARELQEELRRQELHHSFDLQLDSMQQAAPTDMQLAPHGGPSKPPVSRMLFASTGLAVTAAGEETMEQ